MSKLIKYQPFISISLFTVLNSAAIIGLTATMVAPEIAQAEIAQVTVSLSRQPREAYPQFLSRAEGLAATAIQNRFKQNKSLSDLSIVVMGENNGAIAPVLTVTVSRQAWIVKPSIQAWAIYFVDTPLLLGFNQSTEKPQPAATPSPSPNASQPEGETKKPESSQPPKKPGENPKKPPLDDERLLSPETPPRPDSRFQTPAKTQGKVGS